MSRPALKPLISLSACVAVALGALSGCAATPGGATERAASAADTASAADCAGVWVEVDFDILGSPLIEKCVEVSASIDAMAALDAAGVTVIDTADYGLDVVCRVNGLPAATQALNIPGHETYRETCAQMTPEFGYWSVWVEDRATGALAYAPVGIDSLTLVPGNSLGLTFTSGTHTDPPVSPLSD